MSGEVTYVCATYTNKTQRKGDVIHGRTHGMQDREVHSDREGNKVKGLPIKKKKKQGARARSCGYKMSKAPDRWDPKRLNRRYWTSTLGEYSASKP